MPLSERHAITPHWGTKRDPLMAPEYRGGRSAGVDKKYDHAQIKNLYEQGHSYKQIAEITGASKTSISRILGGKKS